MSKPNKVIFIVKKNSKHEIKQGIKNKEKIIYEEVRR